jgi:hypothetical protein
MKFLAALILTAGLVGCASPATHQAGPTPDPSIVTEGTVVGSEADLDNAFIAALQLDNFPIPNRYAAISLGHATCRYFNGTPGATYIDAALIVKDPWPAEQAGWIVAAAISSYCPEHMPKEAK